MIRQVQNYENTVLKRIDELLDRSVTLSKEKKNFLISSIASLFLSIRNLFSDKPGGILVDKERSQLHKQESFKNYTLQSSNPMLNLDKNMPQRKKMKEKSTSAKSSKSNKSMRSSKLSSIGDVAVAQPISNSSLELSMRSMVTLNCQNSCSRLCDKLINIVIKICMQKQQINNTNNNYNDNNNNIKNNTTMNSNNNSSKNIQMNESSTKSSKSQQNSRNLSPPKNKTTNEINNTNNNTLKQKGKVWDNLLTPEKFLVDEICCFLGDVGDGSRVLLSKWGEALGSLAMLYWRVCDGAYVYV